LAGEHRLSRLAYVLAWFLVVDLLITMFGLMTAPLLLALAADAAVIVLLVRSIAEKQRPTGRLP
jgi:hypothetical protein